MGAVLLLIGAGLLWLGVSGLLGVVADARKPVQCSSPGNPDCLPIAGEDSGYRDVALLGGVLLALGGLTVGLGIGPRTADAA